MKIPRKILASLLILSSVSVWGQMWSTPETVSDPTLSSNPTNLPPITVDAQGNAFTIWVSTESSLNVVRASHFDATTQTWSSPEQIGSDSASDVHAATTTDGKIVAVWTNSASTPTVYVNIFDGSSWSGEQAIDTNPTYQTQFYPRVAIDHYGRALIVWQVQGGNLARVIRSTTYFFDTNTWATPTNISTDYGVDNQFVASATIALNDSGRAVSTWLYQDSTTSTYKVQGNVYSGAWLASGSEEDLVTSSSDSIQFTAQTAAVAPNGNMIALWAQYDGTTSPLQEYTVMSSVRNLATSLWSTPLQVSDTGNADVGKVFIDVACDPAGDAQAIWLLKDESVTPHLSSLWASAFPHLSWSTTSTLVSDPSYQALVSTLALDGLGDGFATWSSTDSTTFVNVQAAQYVKSANAWQAPQTVSGNGFFSLGGPNQISGIGSNQSGDFFTVWSHEDPSTSNILVQAAYTSLPPASPSNFVGVVINEQFLNTPEYILEARWNASSSSNVISYRIYNNTTLVADVSASQPLLFVKLSCSASEFDNYQIAAVDSSNQESDRISLQIL